MGLGSPGRGSQNCATTDEMTGGGSAWTTSSSAEAIHGHHRQKRTTAPAVGRSGDILHDQTDRPRPSRSRSGPGVQHGRDRPDWRRVVHDRLTYIRFIRSRARPSMMAGRRPTSTRATGSGPGYWRYWHHWRYWRAFSKTPRNRGPQNPVRAGPPHPRICRAHFHPFAKTGQARADARRVSAMQPRRA